MKLSLLYLDDCYQPESQITALTGVFVPASTYSELAGAFYQGLMWAITPEERTYNLHPPELHGSEMLRGREGVDDARRLEMFAHVAELVVAKGLRLLRVGNFLTPRLKKAFAADPRMITSNFANIVRLLQPRLATEQVIPIMDGFQNVKTIAGSSQAVTVMRQTDLRRALTLENSENLVGEVLFADSKFSVFTQVADVVGYLRLVSDMASEELPLSPFKAQLLPIARTLDNSFDYEEIVVITLNDVPQEPRHRAQRKA